MIFDQIPARYNEDWADTKTVMREEKFLDEDKKTCRRLTIIDSNERHGYYQEQDDQEQSESL